MQKSRYAVDSRNRLVIRRGTKTLKPAGSFAIKENALYYWLNEPQPWLRANSLPKKLKFTGAWKLNKNRDLVLDLSQGRNLNQEDTLTLRGRILPVHGDLLSFALAAEQPGRRKEYSVIHLTGEWKAAPDNGLFFEAKKRGSPDILSLGTGWKLDARHQLVYSYEKKDLATRTKSAQAIEFRGAWELRNKNFLAYVLERGVRSAFNFRAQIETPNIYPQKGAIKFRLGAGVKQQSPETQKVITLYGAWKFSTPFALTFEIDHLDGRVSSWEFGADIDLSRKDRMIFAVRDSRHQPLGFKVTFSRRFLQKLDAEVFVRLKKLSRETALETGVSVPF